MIYYAALKSIKDVPQKKRTILGLQRLRAALDNELPPRLNDGRLLLATWNIRELDAGKYGPRLDESYFYIAEIISCFDIVAAAACRRAGCRGVGSVCVVGWESHCTRCSAGIHGEPTCTDAGADAEPAPSGARIGDAVDDSDSSAWALPAMHVVLDNTAPKIRDCIKSVDDVEVEYSTAAA